MFARLNTSRSRNFVLEIVMIVVGINIALWFEGWFEDLKDAETEQQYLVGLRDDLLNDIRLLDDVIEFNSANMERLAEIVGKLPELKSADADEQLGAMFVPSSYHFFEPEDFTYRSMQESGDFRLLSDPETKKRLLQLVRHYRLIGTLQDNFLQALDDGYIPLLMTSADLAAQRMSDPAIFDNMLFRNFFAFTRQDTATRVAMYGSARDLAQDLVIVIESQIRD